MLRYSKSYFCGFNKFIEFDILLIRIYIEIYVELCNFFYKYFYIRLLYFGFFIVCVFFFLGMSDV